MSERDSRLIYVHNAPIPSMAANAVQVAKMCCAFEAVGMPTTLVVPEGMAGTPEELVSVYHLPSAIDLQTAPHLRLPGRELLFGALAGQRFRHPNRALFYTRSISIAYSLAATGCDVVLEMHGPVLQMRPALRRRLKQLVGSRRLRHIILISHALRRHYAELFPLAQHRMSVAHDGADPHATLPSPKPLTGTFKVAYVGQLYPGKGMELVAAMAPLLPDATFHIIGGLAKDVEYWRVELGSRPNVIFHGYVPHAQTASYIAAANVLIAPYLRTVRGVGGGEANLADWMSPLKLFEYMAAGKAIVTSDLPVLKEVVEHGRDALLCDPDRPEEWAAALSGLAMAPHRQQQLGARAQAKFLANYTWQQRAQHILRNVGAVRAC